jgi:ABC-2 type transport system ATP-binding protein
MNANETPAVRFQDVVKHFGSFTAVGGVSFEVPRGSLFGILGSNGAGKTTSIRMLMNIFKPDGGTVEVFGTQVSDAMKPRLGYLPEERGLYKKMRVEEMLRFFGHIKGRDDAFLTPRIDAWLERVGLRAWRTRRVEELSKGMSQKLQFVVTVIHEPELVVLDEPFAGLDPVNRDVLRDAVLSLHQEGTTVVFSTHVMEQAEQLCRQLIMIHQGEVRLSGTLDEVRRSEGRKAAHVRCLLRAGQDLQGLPGVSAVADSGNEAELTLQPDADANALLAALLKRGELRSFDVREPSLHEIFKRVAGSEA